MDRTEVRRERTRKCADHKNAGCAKEEEEVWLWNERLAIESRIATS